MAVEIVIRNLIYAIGFKQDKFRRRFYYEQIYAKYPAFGDLIDQGHQPMYRSFVRPLATPTLAVLPSSPEAIEEFVDYLTNLCCRLSPAVAEIHVQHLFADPADRKCGFIDPASVPLAKNGKGASLAASTPTVPVAGASASVVTTTSQQASVTTNNHPGFQQLSA